MLRTVIKVFSWLTVFSIVFTMVFAIFFKDTEPAPVQNQQPAKVASAKNEQKTLQLQLAGLGLMDLQRLAKSKKTFNVESVVLKDSGVACYEFSGINAYGVERQSAAVMAKNGKLFVKDSGSSQFYSLWNKECTKPGGEEIAWFLKRVLD